MAIDIGSENLNIRRVRRTWRGQVFIEGTNPAKWVVEIFRETAKILPDNSELPPDRELNPIRKTVQQMIDEGDGAIVSLLIQLGDKWDAEQLAQQSPPPEP